MMTNAKQSAPTMTQADYAAAVATLKAGISASFDEMSRLRHQTALAKIPYVIEHLQSAYIDAGVKVVVFAHHHDVIDALKAAFPKAAVVDGRVLVGARRQAEVDRFQQDPECNPFIGEIQAAGVGLTLTAASHVVFAELDWVPGNMTQAEDRCHRIGQQNAVLVQHLVLEGSLDANMVGKLVSKQDVITAGLDARTEQVFETPEQLAERVARESVKTPKSGKTVVAKPTIDDPEHIAQVHRALRCIAGVCDGAQALDGIGFNGCDTNFGRSLAAYDSISPRMAYLAARMLLKYRRQLGEELMQACKDALASVSGVAPAQTTSATQTTATPESTQQTPAKPQETGVQSVSNPYRVGSQLAQAYNLLSDGKFHTRDEFRAINPKYPMDPVAAIEKDAKKYGWTINRTRDGVQWAK